MPLRGGRAPSMTRLGGRGGRREGGREGGRDGVVMTKGDENEADRASILLELE